MASKETPEVVEGAPRQERRRSTIPEINLNKNLDAKYMLPFRVPLANS
jgi:hypothetical protein